MLKTISYSNACSSHRKPEADLRRTGKDSVGPLIHGQALLNLMAMGVYGFLMIAAEPTLVFLYGEPWREAAAFVPPMMLAALIGSAFERLATPIYIAHGRVDVILKIQALLAPITILALFIATPFGIMPALWTLVGTSLLRALFDLFFLPKLIPVERMSLVRAFQKAVLVTLPAMITGYIAAKAAIALELETFWHLLLTGLPYLATFAVSIFLFGHPLADEIKRFSLSSKALSEKN